MGPVLEPGPRAIRVPGGHGCACQTLLSHGSHIMAGLLQQSAPKQAQVSSAPAGILKPPHSARLLPLSPLARQPDQPFRVAPRRHMDEPGLISQRQHELIPFHRQPGGHSPLPRSEG